MRPTRPLSQQHSILHVGFPRQNYYCSWKLIKSAECPPHHGASLPSSHNRPSAYPRPSAPPCSELVHSPSNHMPFAALATSLPRFSASTSTQEAHRTNLRPLSAVTLFCGRLFKRGNLLSSTKHQRANGITGKCTVLQPCGLAQGHTRSSSRKT